MQIVIARKRIQGTLPHYTYQVLIPFDQISIERQNLIHNRSDYGVPGSLWAKVAEVIAPMEYLRMPPGLAKHDAGGKIHAVAKRVETTVVRHFNPEMTAAVLPLVFTATTEHDERTLWTDIDEFAGQYERLAARAGALRPSDLGIRDRNHARAA